MPVFQIVLVKLCLYAINDSQAASTRGEHSSVVFIIIGKGKVESITRQLKQVTRQSKQVSRTKSFNQKKDLMLMQLRTSVYLMTRNIQ